jgi:hypothetical protein
MISFKDYLNSFKFNNRNWYCLVVDVIFAIILTIVFVVSGQILNSSANKISLGMDANGIKEYLLTAPINQVQAYSTNLQVFVITIIVLTILLLVITLFLYSLSRALIWNKLNNKKLTKKTYWRWNALNLALLIPLFLYWVVSIIILTLVSGIITLLTRPLANFAMLHPTFMQNSIGIVMTLITSFLILLFLVFTLLTYNNFAKTHLVGKSMLHSYQKIIQNKKYALKIILFAIITSLVLGLITFGISKLPLISSVQMIIGVLLSLLYLAWLRIYLIKTIA